MKEIINVVKKGTFSSRERRSRQNLIKAVNESGDSVRQTVQETCLRKKRARDEERNEVVKRARMEAELVSTTGHQPDANDEEVTDEFLESVDEEIQKQCISRYLLRTGSDAVRQAVCVVCAGEYFAFETERMALLDVPHKELLIPTIVHRAQVLTDGFLLYRPALRTTLSGMEASICSKCLQNLRANKLPSASLANGLWIGDVPDVLSLLTLPERLLVAIYYPAAYIVKLYPKRKGAKYWNVTGLNSGVRGNVSTYRLNTADIADMVNPKCLPPNAAILAATIGVTIVGPNNFPDRCMPHFLTVNRNRVHDALRWLKRENPLYEDIAISDENLQLLPVNGIPEEISHPTRYSDDILALEVERDGYTVDGTDKDEIESEHVDEDMFEEDSGGCDSEREANKIDSGGVFQLQTLGVVDAAGSDVQDNEMFAHAFANIAGDHHPDYAVKRGRQYVNEYARRDEEGNLSIGARENPNHLLGAFPCLFPYALGGFEVNRPLQISYAAHAKWALRYGDRRFRKDLHFMFQIFGVLQKRQVSVSTSLQVKKKTFQQNETLFHSIRAKDLQRASEEESNKQTISNPAVASLKRHVSTVRSKVMGTDESRIGIRSYIWGMSVMKGPPSLWITINPTDTHDPVAQVFAGQDIDLDNFNAALGPDPSMRASIIIGDPYAAAWFFHFTIETILEELFGIRGYHHGSNIKRHKGIYGTVEGYIGTVEAQGRGTLHLHILLWLHGAPTAQHMQDLLRSEAFREKIIRFIALNIHAHIEGLTIANADEGSRNHTVSFSRPVDPKSSNFVYEALLSEQVLAKIVQRHQCGPGCIKVIKGCVVCKRHTPFAISPIDWIDSEGKWGPRQNHPYYNNWNPVTLLCTRSNNDVKLITNGGETQEYGWYITSYAAKKQHHTSNGSALLAKTVAFHQKQERYNFDLQQLNKRLVQRCANTLSREQEFSAPEVSSYIMDWDDRYISHQMETIHFSSVISRLKKVYPVLKGENHSGLTTEGTYETFSVEDIDEYATLEFIEDSLYVHDQMREYIDRGDALEDFNYMTFFLHTYDGPQLPSNLEESCRGQKPAVCVNYREGSTHKNRCRVIRSDTADVIPNFPGKWFPRSDVAEEHGIYCASILALLKPWRSLSDLKQSTESFNTAFDLFVQQASHSVRNIIDNIQYFHQCSASARKHRAESQLFHDTPVDEENDQQNAMIADEDEDPMAVETSNQHVVVTEAEVEYAMKHPFSSRETLYAEAAMNVAFDSGIFSEESSSSCFWRPAPLAVEEDREHFEIWDRVLCDVNEATSSSIIKQDLSKSSVALYDKKGYPHEIDDELGVELLYSTHTTADPVYPHTNTVLNEEQQMALDIITRQLSARQQGRSVSQLLMIVTGQGGTGKSALLKEISKMYEEMGCDKHLAKTALSGVAACLIGGCTIHSWAGLPSRSIPRTDTWATHPTADMEARRRHNIGETWLLAIDECSMMTTELLVMLSQVMSITCAGTGGPDSTVPFGGIDLMLMGDFHQFPPIAQEKKSLYCSHPPNQRCELGQGLFHQFQTVVELHQQMRINDSIWTSILQRARNGECTASDVNVIRSLILNNGTTTPDFMQAPWNESILITPRNSVRTLWNNAALEKHCRATGNIKYTFVAEDSAFKRHLLPAERLAVASLSLDDSDRLPTQLSLAIGMKVMVTKNLCLPAGIANGARGSICDIILDQREPSMEETQQGVIQLYFPPAVVFFQPELTSLQHISFPGLAEDIIPIFPTEGSFYIHSEKRFKIKRRQLALTAAYAFTDIKSQGQTIEHVVVDLGRTTCFALNPFNAYVALSRSRGRDNIRLLRDFDEKLFTHPPSEDLLKEDIRLANLAEETKKSFKSGRY